MGEAYSLDHALTAKGKAGMTYTLATELLEGEEREAIRLLGEMPMVTIRIEDAWVFWPLIVGYLCEAPKSGVMVTRGADYVKITKRIT